MKNYPLSKEKVEAIQTTSANDHPAVLSSRLRDLAESHEVLRDQKELYQSVVEGIAELIEKLMRPMN